MFEILCFPEKCPQNRFENDHGHTRIKALSGHVAHNKQVFVGAELDKVDKVAAKLAGRTGNKIRVNLVVINTVNVFLY